MLAALFGPEAAPQKQSRCPVRCFLSPDRTVFSASHKKLITFFHTFFDENN